MNFHAIGTPIYIAIWESTQVQYTCPDCGGTKRLKITMWDGTEHVIFCEGCKHGYKGPRGYLTKLEYRGKVLTSIVSGLEVDGTEVKYKYNRTNDDYRVYTWTSEAANVFLTESEAIARANVLAEEGAANQEVQLKQKNKDHRSWAWHVTYYRRQIRDAERQIEYAQKMLGIAMDKKREEKVTPADVQSGI